jgi:nicotinate-nucleotide pyrophosphorylase (carboxylating)
MHLDPGALKSADFLSREDVRRVIRAAVQEDVGPGDATTLALVPEDCLVEACILTRHETIAAGLGVADWVFRTVDMRIVCEARCKEGDRVAADKVLLSIKGPARAILTAERTALNFMQRMCGIATLTRRFVDRVRGSRTVILDTRKTTPGLRLIEKYAVLCGGGSNHRMGLHDRILIKDNHRRLWARGDASRLDLAIREAREKFPGLLVEVEVETDDELQSALAGEPEWILLDNMSPERMAVAVGKCKGRCRTEASGGITLETIEAVARAGVDAVSLGCLTHSAPAADLSLEITTHDQTATC